jgi:hypothetical protein
VSGVLTGDGHDNGNGHDNRHDNCHDNRHDNRHDNCFGKRIDADGTDGNRSLLALSTRP